MQTDFDFTPVIELLVAVLSAVVTVLVIPMLKQKLSKEKCEALETWVSVAVRAAEQIYGSKTGQQKKDYVLSFLLSKGIVFDTEEVVAMIESEVYKLAQKVSE